MKQCLAPLAALLFAGSTYAQGTVNFVNKITGVLDAPVIWSDWGPNMPAVGGGTSPATMIVAQLWQISGTPGPVGDPIPFRGPGAGAGYWVGATRTLAGVPENSTATVKVVAWTTAFGPTYNAYNAVMALGMGGFGESAPITINTGGGLNPPAPLTGLTSFSVSFVPEPSFRGLALLGVGMLWVRRTG